LTENGEPVNGTVNLAFFLYDAAIGGSQIGGPALLNDHNVENGLLTVILNANDEFGPTAFDGGRRWLWIWVNGVPLSPRQEVTATPYAHFALSVPWSGLTDVPDLALLDRAQTFTAPQSFAAGVTTNALHLSASPQDGYVLTSDAAGSGTWQALPPAQIPIPLELTSDQAGVPVIHGVHTRGEDNSAGVRGDGQPGVRGAGTSGGMGVLGTTSGGAGVGGYNFGPPGGTGVFGWTNSTESGTTAVAGVASGSSGNTYGGLFEVNSPTGVALQVRAGNGGWAGRFEANGTGGNGIYISAQDVGLQVASGTKSAVVRTADGARALYCEEATEVWFVDYGSARLRDGRATVPIDAVFAETVSLNETYHVFVQAEGECEGVYVASKTPTTFEIVELRGGRSNAPFSYRLVAKRRGYEELRMERAPHADDDPNLFPERRASWEARSRPIVAGLSVSRGEDTSSSVERIGSNRAP
jgi:hypothetical protein